MTIILWIVCAVCVAHKSFCVEAEGFEVDAGQRALQAQEVVRETFDRLSGCTREALQDLGFTCGEVVEDFIKEVQADTMFVTELPLDSTLKHLHPAINKVSEDFMHALIKKSSIKRALDPVLASACSTAALDDLGVVARLRKYDTLLREVDRLYKRLCDRRDAVELFSQIVQRAVQGVVMGVRDCVSVENAVNVLRGEPTLQSFLEQLPKIKSDNSADLWDVFCTSVQCRAWDTEFRYVILKIIGSYIRGFVCKEYGVSGEFGNGASLRKEAQAVAQKTLDSVRERTEKALLEVGRAQTPEILETDLSEFYVTDNYKDQPETLRFVKQVFHKFEPALLDAPKVQTAVSEVLSCVGQHTYLEDNAVIRNLEHPTSLMVGVLTLENRMLTRKIAVQNFNQTVTRALCHKVRFPGPLGRVFSGVTEPMMQAMARIMTGSVTKEYRTLVARVLKEGVARMRYKS